MSELGVGTTARPASGSDIYAVSEDSAHAVWSQYQDQIAEVEGVRRSRDGQVFSDADHLAVVTNGISGGTNGRESVALSFMTSEGDRSPATNYETDLGEQNDESGEYVDISPQVPRRKSSIFPSSVGSAEHKSSQPIPGAVAGSESSAEEQTPVIGGLASTSLPRTHIQVDAADNRTSASYSPGLKDVYTDADDIGISPIREASPGLQSFARAESALDNIRPVASSARTAPAGNSLESDMLATTDEEYSDSHRLSASDASASDYGSDIHEEILQRPPRRQRNAELLTSAAAGNGSQQATSRGTTDTPARKHESGSDLVADAEQKSMSPEMKAEEQAALEAQLAKEADERDPSRPKTLQEARAMARERAKLRQQGEVATQPLETGHGRDASVDMTPTARARPKRDPRRENSPMIGQGRRLLAEAGLGAATGSSIDPLSATADGQAGSELEVPERTMAGQSVTSLRDKRKGQVSPVLLPTAKVESQQLDAIEDLQASVTAAIQDVSFGSVNREAPSSSDVPNRPTLTPRQSSMSSMAATVTTGSPTAQHSPVLQTRKNLPIQQGTPGLRQANSAPGEQRYPQVLHAIGRIEVYGKTVPWPPAFDSGKITEKHRNPAWDRAKLYANAANSLLATPSNLSAWMQAKQRPASKQNCKLRS